MLRPLERFGWQKKRVADYIEDHLDEEIPLQELAEVARLSRYHFLRGRSNSRSGYHPIVTTWAA
jgi:AraC-like DNA-binding protein